MGRKSKKNEDYNVDFNGVSFDPLDSRSPPYEGIKFGYPFKTRAISANVDYNLA